MKKETLSLYRWVSNVDIRQLLFSVYLIKHFHVVCNFINLKQLSLFWILKVAHKQIAGGVQHGAVKESAGAIVKKSEWKVGISARREVGSKMQLFFLPLVCILMIKWCEVMNTRFTLRSKALSILCSSRLHMCLTDMKRKSSHSEELLSYTIQELF